MKLTVAVKLMPTAEQASLLRETLEQANAACATISAVAWDHQVFGQFKLHGLTYHDVRQTTGLTAQVVVRAIAKVVDAYKIDKKTRRTFRPYGAFAFDDRILRWQDGAVSIWTVGKRQTIPFVCGDRTRDMLATRQGESDLVVRGGKWFLFATVNVEVPPSGDPVDFLGVDLGIGNHAATSDGELIYLAGHFDGEGSIYMTARRECGRARLRITVTSAYRPTLEAYQRRFGGHIGPSSRSVNHDLSRWMLDDMMSMHSFLSAIQPFSREKRSQIDAAVAYLTERLGSPIRGSNGPATRHLNALSHTTAKSLRSLKRA
jgi:hypothetical protein